MITAFCAGLYLGGVVVDFTTGIFIGETKKEAALGSAIWPYNALKLVVTHIRKR